MRAGHACHRVPVRAIVCTACLLPGFNLQGGHQLWYHGVPGLSAEQTPPAGGSGALLTVMGAGWSVKVPTARCLVRALFLASGRPSLAVSAPHFLDKDPESSLGPSFPNSLLTSSVPSTVTLGIRLQHRSLGCKFSPREKLALQVGDS